MYLLRYSVTQRRIRRVAGFHQLVELLVMEMLGRKICRNTRVFALVGENQWQDLLFSELRYGEMSGHLVGSYPGASAAGRESSIPPPLVCAFASRIESHAHVTAV